MAFRVRATTYRAWPVTVKLAECDEHGEITETEHTFVGHWRPISEKQRRQLIESLDKRFPPPDAGDGKVGDVAEVLERNAAYFAERLCGWGPEVQDADGNTLPYSVEALTSLVTGDDGLAISAALNLADTDLRYGLSARKNSKPSPAPGASSTGQGEGPTNSPPT